MKKFFLAAIGLSMLASCQQQPAAVENTEKGIRLAYVRIDSLQSQYNYFQELVGELQAEEEKIVVELQRRQQELQTNIELYQQEAPKMTARQREANEADLRRVQQNYLQVEQAAQGQMMQRQNDLTVMMREDMNSAIEILKEELNLDFILLYEEGGQIIYANDEYDITERMVNMLNENRENPTEEEEAVSEATDSAAVE
ncbi:MAG: OmpH family outer membrane protein [Schleiferiaceae bacterium]|jgi:outer membrane protein|nr:OmpH family outer membrane protein [Schleiferiaceae bacterium]MDG1918668.1 OmpH family outer membrane protein [Schleiferiaceae bacterium]